MMTTKTVYSVSYDDWCLSSETKKQALDYGNGDETSIYQGTATAIEWDAVFTLNDTNDFKETLSTSLYEAVGDFPFYVVELDEFSMRAVILSELKRQNPDTGYYLIDDIKEVSVDTAIKNID